MGQKEITVLNLDYLNPKEPNSPEGKSRPSSWQRLLAAADCQLRWPIHEH